MSPKVLTALRTLAQFIVTALLAATAGRVPDFARGWITETLVFGVLLFLVTYALRWLETRTGAGIWSRLARGLAAVLMLGLSARQPIYPAEPGAYSEPK